MTASPTPTAASTAPLLLYHSPGACSLAVHITLEEIGVPYELALVSVRDGATQAPGFLAVNPKGRVPVLAVGGERLTELPAIQQYLALTHPQAALLPEDAWGRARCAEWFNYLSGTLHAVAYGGLWRPARFVEDAALFDAVRRQGLHNVRACNAHVESLLQGRRWAVGERFGCVDPFLFVFHRWGTAVGLDMARDCPAWSAHAQRMRERPAVQRALAQEGLGA